MIFLYEREWTGGWCHSSEAFSCPREIITLMPDSGPEYSELLRPSLKHGARASLSSINVKLLCRWWGVGVGGIHSLSPGLQPPSNLTPSVSCLRYASGSLFHVSYTHLGHTQLSYGATSICFMFVSCLLYAFLIALLLLWLRLAGAGGGLGG